MATKPRDTSHGKEKVGYSSSSPSKLHQHETTHGKSSRLTHKSSIPTSPDKIHGILSDNSTPKHTLSSLKEPGSKVQHGKKPVSNDTSSHRFTRRKSFDKPPSPAKLQRTLSSSSLREKTPIKVSSPTPKTIISPRPISEKKNISPKSVSQRTSISRTPVSERTSKTLRNVKTVQPASSKPNTLRRSSSINSSKSGVKSSPAPSVASSIAPISPETTEISYEFKVDQEEKNILEHEVLEQEILKVEGEEEIPYEIPPDQDQVLIDHHFRYSESPTNSDMEKPHILDTPTLEEQEQEEIVIPTPQIEETQEKTIEHVHKENQNEDEQEKEYLTVINEENNDIEFSDKQIESNTESESREKIEPKVEGEDETMVKPIIEKSSGSTGEKSEEIKPFKLKFKQVKELEVEVQDGGTPQKLKFKERETQDVKGKKDTQAYNDVIEETAKKLAEKRKNKVLALAGAFETVISLQEPEGQ